jgi:hypothetical protein
VTQNIISLKDLHKGEDIYVLGSGTTLDFIDKDFFNNKITVSVNNVGVVYLPTTQYVVTKYHREAIDYAQRLPNSKVVVSRGNLGNGDYPELPNLPNLYYFNHNINKDYATSVNEWLLDEDALFVSWSSITSAMHLAAYLGAKNIIMVAHDCGELDDKGWVSGYPTETWDEIKIEEAKERNRKFEIQSIAVKKKLIELYGCNVYSLNPFINYSLEGHKYRGTSVIN